MQLTKLELPRDATFRERLRLAWKVLRFVTWANRLSPAEQDRVLNFLAEQPGVTVTQK